MTPKEFSGGFFFAGMWQAYSQQLTDYIKSRGYDGILIDAPDKGDIFEIVVFEPNQIKSISNLYPTHDDNFVNNSRTYLKEHLHELTAEETMRLAKYIKQHNEKGGEKHARIDKSTTRLL